MLILRFFRKPYFKILDTINKGWGYLCIVPALLSATIYLLLYYPTEIKNWPENLPITILVIALMFVCYVIFYQNFANITQYYQLKHDREFLLLQTNLQKREYAAIMDKVNTGRIFRHDMRHHINVVHTFLNDNNISEAENYLNKLNEHLIDTVVEQYCSNYLVNVILSSYISKAKDADIDVKCKAFIPENLKIDNVELATIFTNALENAINACKNIENPTNKKISIVCKKHYNQIYIQIRNTFVGDIVFNGEYPVSNSKDHGFGTKSIGSIAEKNGGVFSFTVKDGIFETSVILND